MNRFDRKLRQMAAEEKIGIPDPVKKKMEAAFLTLPQREESAYKAARPWPKAALAAIYAAIILIFVMPNVSVAYAQSMEKIPILGDLIHVVTIRNYFYSDSRHEMNISVPHVSEGTAQDADKRINADVDAFTQSLVQQFYEDLERTGKQGYGAIHVDYAVQTNTPRWFTLKLSVHLEAGSSTRYFKYYHIDRNTGKVVQLSDLFRTPDFNEVITEDIKQQMQQRMLEDPEQSYFTKNADFGGEFAEVDDAHNFYLNSHGELVIPFDKYEVAPGYMGCPEFIIGRDVIGSLLKDEYQDMPH